MAESIVSISTRVNEGSGRWLTIQTDIMLSPSSGQSCGSQAVEATLGRHGGLQLWHYRRTDHQRPTAMEINPPKHGPLLSLIAVVIIMTAFLVSSGLTVTAVWHCGVTNGPHCDASFLFTIITVIAMVLGQES